jgi:hypothetical protein
MRDAEPDLDTFECDGCGATCCQSASYGSLDAYADRLDAAFCCRCSLAYAPAWMREQETCEGCR